MVMLIEIRLIVGNVGNNSRKYGLLALPAQVLLHNQHNELWQPGIDCKGIHKKKQHSNGACAALWSSI